MKKRKLLNLVFFVFLVISCATVSGKDSSATNRAFEKAMQLVEENNDSISKSQSVQLNIDTGLLKRMNEYHFIHQQRSFTWQYYSGIIIFILVVIIVAMGLWLSYKQFTLNERLVTSVKPIKSMEDSETSTSTSTNAAQVFTTSTMEIGKDGLKMNTAVIGLMILGLSIAFFFLYLKYVYPVTFID